MVVPNASLPMSCETQVRQSSRLGGAYHFLQFLVLGWWVVVVVVLARLRGSLDSVVPGVSRKLTPGRSKESTKISAFACVVGLVISRPSGLSLIFSPYGCQILASCCSNQRDSLAPQELYLSRRKTAKTDQLFSTCAVRSSTLFEMERHDRKRNLLTAKG